VGCGLLELRQIAFWRRRQGGLLFIEARTRAAFSPTALLQGQLVVLTETAHLVNHCQGNLTDYQTTCSQQIWAFKVCTVEVLNTCVDGEAGGQH